MSDTTTNAPAPSVAGTITQAVITVLEMFTQDASIGASAAGDTKLVNQLGTGLAVAGQVAPSLFSAANVLGALGTLLIEAGQAHAASSGTS